MSRKTEPKTTAVPSAEVPAAAAARPGRTELDRGFERGLARRRQMLGDAWVDQSIGRANSFNAPFQNLITRYAWHEIWNRPGLPGKSRRIIVLAITAALGRWEEFELHTRAALMGGPQEGLTPDELREVLMQSAIYAGVPAANTAFTHAQKILRELGYELPAADATTTDGGAEGRSGRSRSRPALHYSVREARNGEARHTVVLSHALGFDASMWDALAARLAAEHRVIVYDHRGHGRSETPAGPWTLAGLADDAERLLAELDAGPVVWIGLSLGGMVGLELAARHPGRVKAMVSAHACTEYSAAGRTLLRERAATVRAEGLDAVADAVLARCFSERYRQAHPGVVAALRRLFVSNLADGYAECCEAVAAHEAGGQVARLKLPLLAIASANDAAVPLALSEALVAEVSGARLAVLPDAGHFSLIEDPAAFEAELRRFLRPLPVSGYVV
jgi:3-oxoadipate enol-lactonase